MDMDMDKDVENKPIDWDCRPENQRCKLVREVGGDYYEFEAFGRKFKVDREEYIMAMKRGQLALTDYVLLLERSEVK